MFLIEFNQAPPEQLKTLLNNCVHIPAWAEKIISEQIDPTEALAGFSHEDYPDVESQLDAIQHILIDDWAQNIPLTTELKANFAKT